MITIIRIITVFDIVVVVITTHIVDFLTIQSISLRIKMWVVSHAWNASTERQLPAPSVFSFFSLG
jgi:hypothetical protein